MIRLPLPERIMTNTSRKLVPERLKVYYRFYRAWLLSIGLRHTGSFSLSDEERRASGLMSVIVAVHDSPRVTERCLKSLETFGGDAEVIIIDDASQMEVTRQILDAFCSRNGWKFIKHERALGHSRSSEAGASISTRPYICFLNSDTIVTHYSWAAMAQAFDLDSRIALAGPSTSYTVGPQFIPRAMHCRHYWSDGQIGNFAEKYVAKYREELVVDLPFLGGFAFFVRRSIWDQFGGFDRNLPDYGNEIDFCRRVKESGLRIVWSKAAYIHHLGSESYGRILGFSAINQRCLQADSYIQKKWDNKMPVERS
jgi:GT2 family glycosyltransferase